MTLAGDDGDAHRSGDAVLQGLCGELVLSYLEPEDLRACIETSRSMRSIASSCVKRLAPRMGLETLGQRFPAVTTVSLDLSLNGEALETVGVSTWLRALAPLRHLQHLQLRGLALTDASLPELAATALPRLESIDMRGCSKLTWAGLGQLARLPSLRHLNCSGIKYSGRDSCTDSMDLHKLLSRLSSLTMGDACTLSWVDDQLMGVVGQHALQLTDLDCGGCIDMTDQGVLGIKRMRMLRSLSLQSCVRLTNNSLGYVAELTNLRHLNIRGCLQLTEVGLKQLSTLTQLEGLGLSCCLGIQVLDPELFGCLRNLNSLNLSNCTTLGSLEGLQILAGSLKDLNISSCSKLTLANLHVLSTLTTLTCLDMSSFHNQTKVDEQAREQLRSLSSLTNMQVLQLSRFRHPHGLPTPLLRAVSAMTSLRQLHLAGCSPEVPQAVPPPSPMAVKDSDSSRQGADVSPGDISQDADVHVSGQQGSGQQVSGPQRSGSQLWFLERLVELDTLDLSGWRHGTMSSLWSLSGLSQLTRLKLQRWGNEVVEVAGGVTRLQHAAEVHQSVAPVLTANPAAKAQHPCSPDSVAGAHPALSSAGWSPDSTSSASDGARTEDQSTSRFMSDMAGLSSLAVEMAAVSLDEDSDSDGSSSSGDGSAGRLPKRGALAPGELLAISSYRSQQQAAVLAKERRLCSMAQALSFLHGMSKLEVLDFEACLALDDSCLHHLAHLGSLRSLHLAGCKRVQGLTFGALGAPSASSATSRGSATPAGCQQLEELCLDDCPLITNQALVAIARLTSLRRLSLKGITAVGDAGLEAVAAGLRRLSHLALFGSSSISSRSLQALAGLPALKSLHVPHCWNIDDEGIAALSRSSSLALLSISHCWRLSNLAIAELKSARPLLTITHSKLPATAF